MRSSLDPSAGGFIYRFGHEYADLLTIEVRINKRFGRMWASLTTYTDIAGAKVVPGTTLVLTDELWLKDAGARQRYAARLQQAIPEPPSATAIDFTRVLEDVALRVEATQNAPITDAGVTGVSSAPTRGYLVDPLLPERLPTVVYGAGGTGKSILAVSLAVAVANGASFLGMQVRKANVLYLDWETDQDDIEQRAGDAARALGVPAPGFRYSRQSQPLTDLSARLVKRCREDDIGLVVIDSMGMAMDFNDARDFSEAAIQMFRVMREIDATVLVLDHIASEDMRHTSRGASKMYGSVYKWNSARNIYELRQSRDPDHDGQHLMLVHRKTNVGPRQQDQYVRLTWANGEARFAYETAASIPTTAPPDKATLKRLLADGPLRPAEVADMLGASEQAVRSVLQDMIVDGTVSATAHDAVGLASSGQEG